MEGQQLNLNVLLQVVPMKGVTGTVKGNLQMDLNPILVQEIHG